MHLLIELLGLQLFDPKQIKTLSKALPGQQSEADPADFALLLEDLTESAEHAVLPLPAGMDEIALPQTALRALPERLQLEPRYRQSQLQVELPATFKAQHSPHMQAKPQLQNSTAKLSDPVQGSTPAKRNKPIFFSSLNRAVASRGNDLPAPKTPQPVPAGREPIVTRESLATTVHSTAPSALSLFQPSLPAPELPITSPAPSVSTPQMQAELPVPLNHPQWPARLGQSLIQFSQQADTGTHSAQLRLDPPHLGPLQITLYIDEGLINAQFYSPHVQVRQSIELALPQLLEQFNQAGLSLGQTHVGSEQQSNFAEHYFGRFATPKNTVRQGVNQGSALPDSQSDSPLRHSVRHHIINTFA